MNYNVFDPSRDSSGSLKPRVFYTYALVTPYGDMELGQQWPR